MSAKLEDAVRMASASSRIRNIAWQDGEVQVSDRTQLSRAEPTTVWLTGLSGSGKSTIAFELERRIIANGHMAYVLDGDNIRHGLSQDLGFSPDDRKENIRRIAEVAKLFNDAGLIVITAFISPYHEDRVMARRIIGADRFIETYICTDLEVCEKRDPKGLYRKVRNGSITEFTGVSAPYETPTAPELRIDTGSLSVSESVNKILQSIRTRFY
jgi:adenylyl-sulfate kinase